MFLMDFLISILGVLLSVAFFTLMERKIMGYSQLRKGPTKTSMMGILQPIADAVKLFNKMNSVLFFLKGFMFLLGPMIGISIMLILWMVFPSYFVIFDSMISMFLLFSLLSLTIYFLFISSLSSSSIYSIIGLIRSISQTISYEVGLMIFLMILMYHFRTISVKTLAVYQMGYKALPMLIPMFFMWLLLSMGESNRTPFDFSEAESELVSGFNTEYHGVLFSLIFIGEYGMMTFMSLVGTIFFLGLFMVEPFIVFFSLIYSWIRCCFPRFRFDLLMMMSWKSMLPLILVMLALMIWI